MFQIKGFVVCPKDFYIMNCVSNQDFWCMTQRFLQNETLHCHIPASLVLTKKSANSQVFRLLGGRANPVVDPETLNDITLYDYVQCQVIKYT